MKAELVLDELMDYAETIKRLHDPIILSVCLGETLRGIHLQIHGDPTPVICDIGVGLIDRVEDWHEDWIYNRMTDINGVEVYWLELKKAPDAATSEGPRDNDGTDIISDDEEEVKEDHHESEN